MMTDGTLYQSASPHSATQERTSLCLICNGGQIEPYAIKREAGIQWNLVRCRTCGFGFVANRPSLDFLQNYYGHLHSPPASTLPRERRADCSRLVAHVASVTKLRGYSLDVGSGDGGFSYYLQKCGFKPVLIDFSPAGEALSADVPGREFHVTSFEEFRPARKFSAILMSQVLEHALDPESWLRHAAERLELDGVLAVAVPNFAGLYRLLGRRDPFLCPPQHLNFFTANSLTRLFKKAGFRDVRVRSASLLSMRRNSMPYRAVTSTWNVLTRVLDPTRFGIILHVFGKR